ncbi:MAG: ATP-binding cassette domain-containing protein [Acidimicrobiia bacterium]|nr:ATP-binding cassette domain-containing protein [Acidimicrobiia bacterium]
MSTLTTTAVDLTGDTALAVRTGEVAVFARIGDGRRIPVTTVAAGTTVAGAGGIDGVTVVAVPIPGAVVDPLPGALAEPDVLHPWLNALAQSAAAGRWPLRRAPATAADLPLAPGECVLNDTADLLWVRVTGGSARLCGYPGATTTASDAAVPLPRGTWLEAGLRCRIETLGTGDDLDAADAARGATEFTRLGVLAAIDRWEDAQRGRRARVSAEVDREHAAIAASVKSLTAAVEPAAAHQDVDAALVPAVRLVQAYGTEPDTAALGQAQDMVAGGSDPVQAVATACGMGVREVRLSDDWSRSEGLPMIVEVADATGRRVPAIVAWRRGWRASDPFTGGDLPLDVAELAGTTARELQPRLPSIPQRLADLVRLGLRGSAFDAAFVVAAGVVTALVAFWSPRLLGRLADLLAERTATRAYVALFAMLAALVVTAALWQMVQSLTLLRLRARATARATVAVWERLIRQPVRWHGRYGIGERIAQGGAVNKSSLAIPDKSVTAVLNLVAVAGSLAAVLSVGAGTFTLIVVLLAAQATISLLLLRRSSRHLLSSLKANTVAYSHLIEVLQAVPRLRVAAAESRALRWWSEAQSKYLRDARSMQVTMMADGVVRAVWPTLVILVLVGGVGTSTGSLGSFVTAQSAATTATTTLAAAMMALGSFAMARRVLQRADPVLAGVPEALGDGEDPGTINGAFTLTDVRFSYPGCTPVIDGLGLTIAPGEHVAFVGPSGCGKTTLLRLLLGLEDPDSGVITCDGHDLAVLDRTAVRRQIGSVLQSSKLLPGSLRENVAMGRPLSTAQIWAALDAAQVGDDIREMPMGLETPMTDGGGTLSGGQQQRVMIARALAGEPRALVLDEATSALDNHSQSEITKVLDGLSITRIVVAHRLSTIRHATRIVVMERGRVAEVGTFEQLMARPGTFRDLMQRQQLGQAAGAAQADR